MHKKRIHDKWYYYTSYRDENGKVKSKYLGNNEKDALKNEREFKGEHGNPFWVYLLIFGLVGVCAIGGFYGSESITGLVAYDGTMTFEWDESWDASTAFVRVALNEETYDLPVSVSEGLVVVDVSSLSFSGGGSGYIDLVVNESVVDSESFEIVNESVEEVNESDSVDLELNESQLGNGTVVENVTVSEEIVENVTVSEELNESEAVVENVTVEDVVEVEENVTVSEEIVQNVTVSEELNESEAVVENVTVEDVVEVEENVTIEANVTVSEELNESEAVVENVTVEEVLNVSKQEEVTQYGAVIGQPVKWKKKVVLSTGNGTVEVDVPKEAMNVSVAKVEGSVKENVSMDKLKVDDGRRVKDIEDTDLVDVEQPFFSQISGFFVASITARVIGYVDAENVTLIVEENVTEVEVEYYTDAPVAYEEVKSFGKTVTVSSDYHYENVLTYTHIPDVNLENVNVYWIVDGVRQEFEFDGYDTNENGLVDYIEWVTPHLSNQSFDISLEILNLYSTPAMGGFWTVVFNATGSGDLNISAWNGTEFGVDLVFVNVTCGDTVVSSIFNGSRISIENYSCPSNWSYETSRVLTTGPHMLKFEYGNLTAYAYNDATNRPTQGIPRLVSSTGSNNSVDNLTLLNISTSDADGDPVKNIYTWKVDGAPFDVVNLPFEGGSSTVATQDYSYFNHALSLASAPVWNKTGGYDGWGSYRFIDNADLIRVPSFNPTSNNNSKLSVFLWMKKEYNNQPYNQILISQNDWGAGERSWSILLDGTTNLNPEVSVWADGAGGSRKQFRGASNVSDTAWHHVGFVWDTGDLKLYVDGELDTMTGVTNASFTSIHNTSADIIVASQLNNDAATNGFNGSIDDVMIFNASLTADQVKLLYWNMTNKIDASMTTAGQVWVGNVTPNDGFVAGFGNESANLTVVSNNVPVISSLVLNSSSLGNTTSENLTANVVVTDADADSTKVVYDWRKNSESVAVLNMPFEAGSNTSGDYSTNSNNGSVVGATWNSTGGYDGFGAYEFDGSDWITIPDATLFDFTDVTLAAWVKADSTGGWRTIFDVDNDEQFFGLNGAIYAGFGRCSGSYGTITTGVWHHVVWVVDGTSYRFYEDGSLVGSGTGCTASVDGTQFNIGSGQDGNEYWVGDIDDVLIFNISLTPEQVRNLYINRTDLIDYNETSGGDNWSVAVTVTDGINVSATSFSEDLSVLSGVNSAPVISSLVLNSSSLGNATSENLTANVVVTDADADSTKVVYDWRKNSESVAVLNMPFEVGSNNTEDYSTNSNNGSVTGATWNSTGGYDGFGAYEFEYGDSTDYINVDDNTVLDTSSAITIEAWINPESYADWGKIVSRPYDTGAWNTPYIAYSLSVSDNTDNGPRFELTLDSSLRSLQGVGAVTLGEWHHVVGTYDGTTMKLYVDGTLNVSTASYSGSMPNTDTDLAIGGRGRYDNGDWYDGLIDEVRVYNRTLSAEQISALYNNRTDLIVSQETAGGENWTVAVTANDGTDESTTNFSYGVSVLAVAPNSAPMVNSLLLNSSNSNNKSIYNITAHVVTGDVDNDSLKLIYNWLEDSAPIMVLNMPFENTSVNTGKDYSGYGNNVSTYGGATWGSTAGVDGKGAYEFTPTDAPIELPNSASLTDVLESDYTWGAWYYPLSYPWNVANRESQTILCKNGWHTQTSYAPPEGKFAFIIYNTGNTGFIIYSENYTHSSWYHVVGVVDDTAKTSELYVNGVLVNSTSYTGTLRDYGSEPVKIGSCRTPSQNYDYPANGTIDDVRIYNRTLSAAEVSAWYNNLSNVTLYNQVQNGENWTVEVTPNDGSIDGALVTSNQVMITSAAPSVTNVLLNSTSGLNYTTDNVSAYVTYSDPDGDSVKLVYDWRKDLQSIAVLNMPFESGNNNTEDYSVNSNNGTVSGATWNATGGYDGFGAYVFDSTDAILVDTFDWYSSGEWTMFAWVYKDGAGDQMIMEHGTGWGGNGFYVNVYSGNLTLTTTSTQVVDPDAFPLNQWVFTTFVKNSTSLSVYVNGELKSSGDKGSFSNPTGDFQVGRFDASTQPWAGLIDEVKVFNKSLSDEQIRALYSNRTDLIVSQETGSSQNWTVAVTPSDTGAGGNTFYGDVSLTTAVQTCVDLDSADSIAANPNITGTAPALTITGDVTFCTDWYNWSVGSVASMFTMSGNGYTVDCGGSTFRNTQANEYGYGFMFSNNDDNITVKNCELREFEIGVYFNAASGASVSFGNLFVNNTMIENDYGFYIYDYSNYNSIVNNTIFDSVYDGIYLRSEADYNNVSGNNISRNGRYGVYVEQTNVDYNTVWNNYFNNSVDVMDNTDGTNHYNSTYTVGTNVLGGSHIGGNAYANLKCVDGPAEVYPWNVTGDGVCSGPGYVIYGTDYVSQAVDVLPLSTTTTGCTDIYGAHPLVVVGNATLCQRNFTLDFMGDRGAIEVWRVSKDGVLDCNGSNYYGDQGTGETGIELFSNSDNATIKNCNFHDYEYGLYANAGSGASVTFGNNIVSCMFNSSEYEGIHIYDYANYNQFVNNTIINNARHGIYLRSESDFNNFSGNIISNNGNAGSEYGLYSETTANDGNLVFNNYFNNTYDVADLSSSGITYYITPVSGENIVGGNMMGGNAWTDLTCIDDGDWVSPYNVSGDGICDGVGWNIQNNAGEYAATDIYPLGNQTTGCTTMTNQDYMVVANATLCQQNHTITYSGGSRGIIEFVANMPAMIDCNGTNYYGDDSSNDYGIEFQSSRDNNTVKNCNFHDLGYGIYANCGGGASLCRGNQIVGNMFNSSGTDNIYVYDYIDYSQFVNNTIVDAGRHGFYFRNDVTNVNITGNRIVNNGNAGSEAGLLIEYTSFSNFYVWNNYFNNTFDVIDGSSGDLTYYITPVSGENIVGGNMMGGNAWTDLTCIDDGDWVSPYNVSGDGICDGVGWNIQNNAGEYAATDIYPLGNQTTGCTTMTNQDYMVVANATLCQQNHTITYSGGSRGIIEFLANVPAMIDCNGTNYYGDGASNDFGVEFQASRDNNTVKNCNFHDLGYGLYANCAGGASLCRGNQIVGNMFNSSGTDNIYVYDYMDYSQFVNNTIVGSGRDGIRFRNDVTNINITGNNILNNGNAAGEAGLLIEYTTFSSFYVWNNYFNNTNDVIDGSAGDLTYYITPVSGENIVGGNMMGGNAWTDLTCIDDGDWVSPYNVSGDGICDGVGWNIQNNAGEYAATDIYPLGNQTTGCTTMTNQDFMVVANATLCQQNHTITYSGGSRGIIEFLANVPAMIDCNGTNYYGDGASNDFGVEFQASRDNNTVKNCNFHDLGYGLYADCASGASLCRGNQIVGNMFNSSGTDNIYVHDFMDYSQFVNNTILDAGRHGVYIRNDLEYVNFTGNNFTGNGNAGSEYGLYMEYTDIDWNRFWNNYFDNTYDGRGQAQNHYNVSKITGLNIIGGSWIGGNYWSDHSGGDADGDTISDTSFSLTNLGTDQLPLTSNYTGGCVYLDNQFSFGSNVTLATDVYVNDNILLCNGNHSVSTKVYLNASNIVVQGNGAIIKGSNSVLFFLNGSFNNVSLLNFTIEGYDLPLKSNNGGNLLVNGLNVYDNTRVFSIENTDSVEINDTKFENWSMYVSNSNVNLTNVMFYNDYVELNYTSVVLDLPSSSHNTTVEIKLWNNTVIVNSTNIPKFNSSAVLTFRNQGLFAPGPIRDGAECPGSVCTGYASLGSNDYRYTVTKFTNYSMGNINAAPNVTTSGLNMSGFLNARVHLNASVQDLNGNGTITGVNFSIKDATGTYLLSNDTGVNSSVNWNSSAFVLNKCGTYTSIVEAWDNEGKNTTVVASVDFVCLDFTFNDTAFDLSETFYLEGLVNFTNSSRMKESSVYIYVNGVEQTTTPVHAWWNNDFSTRIYFNVSVISDSDFSGHISKVNFSTSDLISAGTMENDCGDVRFADSDGFELNYTLDTSTCNTTNTFFWVWGNYTDGKIVYAYHGNSTYDLVTDYTIPDEDSLILYYHFDQATEYSESGSVVYDFSRNWNSSFVQQAAINSSGYFGGALQEDGVGDYIDPPNFKIYNTGMTLTWWSYVAGWSFTDHACPGWGGDFFNIGGENGQNNYVAQRTYGITMEDNAGAGKTLRFEGHQNNTWEHYAVVFNSSGTYAYKNGIYMNSSTTLGTYIVFNVIGSGYGSCAFDGLLDELRLYNSSLNPDEIGFVYNGSSDLVTDFYYQTNTTGGFSGNYSAPSSPGTYDVKVNTTHSSLYGENIETLTVYQYPAIDSVVVNSTASLNKNLYLVANITDDNLVGVNFTVVDPSGAQVVNNLGTNGTSAYYQWNSSMFTLNKSGTYNYTVVVLDNNNLEVNTTGQIDFITVSLNFNASYGYTEGQVNVYGRVNYTNGSLVKSGNVYGFVDGVLNTTGGGADGDLTVTTENYVVNNYTYLMSNQSSSDTQILVNNSAGFSADDYVMIWQVQNGTGLGNAGTYEFAKIDSVSAHNLTLTAGLSNTYGSGVFNSSSSSVTQVVRVPQFGAVNVSATGSIVADAWDGWKGGVVVFNSSGTVDVEGEINVTGKGFRGGTKVPSSSNYQWGYAGERITGVNTGTRETTSASFLMGGGAGKGADGSGGGGAYGADAVDGAKILGSSDVGLKGTEYGDENLSNLYFGGGGGSAGSHDSSRTGGPGGAGGGILLITADTINVPGKILVKGGKPAQGIYALDGNSGAGGGGGAGGAIYLKASTISVAGQVNASYGEGGDNDPTASTSKDGGNGSVGRVRMDFTTLTGASVPVQVNGSFAGVSGGLQTNSSGDYSFNLTFGSAGGTKTVKVNSTQSGLYGETSSTISVYQNPVIDSVALNATAGLNKNLYLVANVTDENLVGVNFTVVDPSGAQVVNNLGNNGTSAYYQWNSSSFTLNKSGTYNYTVVVWDNDDLEVNTTGQVDFIVVGLNFNQSFSYTEGQVNVYGRVNYTNGSLVKDNVIGVYLNGVLNGSNTGWWNVNWNYRTGFTLEPGVAIDMNNAIVMVNFSTLDYVEDGKMNAGCNDVRFVDNVSNELQFTMDPGSCNTSDTKFWVWTNLTASQNSTVYAYYGNSGASFNTGYTNPDKNLVLYMHFDNSTQYAENDSHVYDFSLNGNNGSGVATAAPVTGVFGGGFELDGDSDYVTIAHDESLDITNNLTLMAWVNLDSTGNWEGIIAKGSATGQYGIQLHKDTGNKLQFTSNYGVAEYVMGGTVLGTDTWYHLAATFTDGNVSVFVNGVCDGSESVGWSIDSIDESMTIGMDPPGSDEYLDGTIDEVRIYNRSLSFDEIYSIYNLTKDYLGANETKLNTNSSGDYSVDLTFGSVSGSQSVMVNTSASGLYGESSSSFMIYGAPVVTNTPANQNYSVNLDSVSLNCSVVDDDGGMSNVTFYHDLNGSWIADTTYALTGNGGSVVHSLDVKDERGKEVDTNFKWNCFAVDNLSLTDWGTNATVGPWDLGTYSSTALNTTSLYLGLDWNDSKQEFSSDWFNMAGNILLLHLDETSGAFIDSSGNGNNAAESGGVTYGATGKLNNALSFDGSDDYLVVTHDAELNVSSEVTISTWVNLAVKNKNQGLAYKGDFTNSYGVWFLSYIQSSSPDGVYFNINNNGLVVTPSTDLNINQWYHIVGTYDGQTAKVYVDGVLDGANAYGSPTALSTDSNDVQIGRYYGTNADRYLNGNLDEYSIWNRSLSADEISDIYAMQQGYYADKGNYTSRVLDSESLVTWSNITWDENVPYGEPLPSNQGVESGAEGMNMSGNVLLFHFDESYGNATDYSGNGFVGNVSGGVTYGVDGVVGQGLQFDGKTGRVCVEHDALHNMVDNITTALWFKPAVTLDSGLSNYVPLVGRQDSAAPDTYSMYINPDGELHFGTNGGNIQSTKNSWSQDKWYFVVVTHRDIGGTRTGEMYINAVNETLSVDSYDNMAGASTELCIAGMQDGEYIEFNGTIDEVSVWNRTLNATEVMKMYKRGALKLNVSTRVCDDAVCAGDSWESLGGNATYTNITNFTATRYFQYRFLYESLNGDVTPELNLSSVYVSYGSANSAPNVTNVRMNSTSVNNYSSGNLQALWDIQDANGDSETDNQTRWFRNGILQTGLSSTNVVDAGNVSKNDVWNLSVRVNDGVDWSNWSDNVSISVPNAPPTIAIVSPTDGQKLVRQLYAILNVSVSDPDSDALNITFYNASTDAVLFTVNNSNATAAYNWSDLVAGGLYTWYANVTDGETSAIISTNNFTANDEPKVNNMRAEFINSSDVIFAWENEPNMAWVSLRVGSEILELRSITSIDDNWTVDKIYPDNEYTFEWQIGDDLLAISDYYNFSFRTLGWNPELTNYSYRRLFTINSSQISSDQDGTALNITLTEDNFEFTESFVNYPGFRHMNWSDKDDIRFVNYMDNVFWDFNVTYWNVPQQGGYWQQTGPNETSSTGTFIDFDQINDTDWDTQATPSPDGIYYYNYSIPTGAKNTSKYRIYDGGWGWDLTLPNDCYGSDSLEFKSEANYTIPAVDSYCKNQSSGEWYKFRNNGNVSAYIYETMMTWYFDAEVHILLMPEHFDDDSQLQVNGVDGDYDVKFWMYYGSSENETSNESFVSNVNVVNNYSFAAEVEREVNAPVISALNDSVGLNDTATNISWTTDLASDQRVRYATNPWMLNSTWVTKKVNYTEEFTHLYGDDSHTVALIEYSPYYVEVVSVSTENSNYNTNYTINSSKNPVEITFVDVNNQTFFNWTVVYAVNRSVVRNVCSAEFDLNPLPSNTTYYYEANAYGVGGNSTSTGSFTLGTVPSTPNMTYYNYSEDRAGKQTSVCFNLTSLNSEPKVNVSIEAWNDSSVEFVESAKVQVDQVGVQCATFDVQYNWNYSYRGKAQGTTIGYSDRYLNEFMAVQEFFAGSYVEDDNDNRFRQYCPDGPNLGYCYEQKGVLEGSAQEEDWMWIETNITNRGNLSLNWWNGTWTEFNMSNTSDMWYIKMENLPALWHTFYVSNDTNSVVLNWTKPAPTHLNTMNRTEQSKYVSFNQVPEVINYSLLYMESKIYNSSAYQWCMAAPGGNLYDCMSVEYWGGGSESGLSEELTGTAYDRGRLFRGGIINGEMHDTGVLNYDRNTTSALGDNERFCFAFTVYWWNESIVAENNITSYYYRYWSKDDWWSSYFGYTQSRRFDFSAMYNWEFDLLSNTRDWSTVAGTTSTSEYTVMSVVNSTFDSNYNQSLKVGYVTSGFELDTGNDNIYNSGFYTDARWTNQQLGKYQQGFVIFNLPDNATLEGMDSDSDGLNDYDELFVYYTNPKSNDTDEDGRLDGDEVNYSLGVNLFTVTGSAPWFTNLTFDRDDYYTNKSVVANLTYYDNESDSSTVYVKWYVEGSNVHNETQTSVANGTVLSLTLDSANYTKAENVSVDVYAVDTYSNQSALSVGNETILNLVPTFNHTFEAKTVNATDVFLYDINCTDVDGDSVRYNDNSSLFNINLTTGVINVTASQNDYGSHVVNISCGDGSGNASLELSYTINDYIVPQVSLIGPDSLTLDTTPTLSVSTNEDTSCYYRVVGGDYVAFTSSDSRLHYKVLSLDYGMHVYEIECNDSAGNSNDSLNIYFYLSTESPDNYTLNTTGVNTSVSGGYAVGNVNVTLNMSQNVSSYLFMGEFENSPIDVDFSLTGYTTTDVGYYSIETGSELEGNMTTVEVVFTYDDTSVDDESVLELYYYNSSSLWQDLDATFDTDANTATVTLDHLSTFAIGTATEVVEEATEESTSAGSGGGGGGGGGGSGASPMYAAAAVENFTVSESEFSFDLAFEESDEAILVITNELNEEQEFELNLRGVGNVMTLSDSEFTLASGESKEVVLHAVSDREAGISSGSLRVEGYGVVSIPVVVEISSQLVLFDGTLYISPKDKEVLPGDGLPVQVTLFNVGSPRKVDVLLNYIISDAEGVTVWEESETIAVEEQHSFNREFYVPSDLGYGSYVLGMEVIYVNSVATSTTMFNVVDQVSRMPLDIEEGFVWYMIVGIVVLILLLVGFVVLKGLYGGEQMVKDLKQGELEKVKKDISELKSAIKKVRK